MSALQIEIKQIEAWQCCRCELLHATEKEAQDCCACEKCGRRFDRRGTYRKVCGPCYWGEDVREARRNIRRKESDLKGARERLQKLLAEKPSRGAS